MMSKEHTEKRWQEVLLESHSLSHLRTYETAGGPLLLFDGCSPEVVAHLHADDGLHAFTHAPEREHQLLLNIAQHSQGKLTLVATFTGEIVGEVTLIQANGWWQQGANVYEIAVQVSSKWRKRGIARLLLAHALESDILEDTILVGLGLCWHWDCEALGLAPFAYRKMLAKLFASYRFVEAVTTEPNIRLNPVNILLVRLGSRIDVQTERLFSSRLIR